MSDTIGQKQPLREDKLIALLLAGLTVLLLVISAPNIGVVWDEPTYFVAAETYPAWFGRLITQPTQALSGEMVAEYWTYNHEHPPFSKVWSGLVWLDARYLFNDLVAHSLGNILLSGMLIGLLYLFLAREYGRTAGLAAEAALLTMPRFFFHSPDAVVWGECHDVLLYYQLRGKLRPDLQISKRPGSSVAFPGIESTQAMYDEADYIVIQYRQSGHYRALREWMYRRQPVAEYKYRRLRLAEIYEQDRFR